MFWSELKLLFSTWMVTFYHLIRGISQCPASNYISRICLFGKITECILSYPKMTEKSFPTAWPVTVNIILDLYLLPGSWQCAPMEFYRIKNPPPHNPEKIPLWFQLVEGKFNIDPPLPPPPHLHLYAYQSHPYPTYTLESYIGITIYDPKS